MQEIKTRSTTKVSSPISFNIARPDRAQHTLIHKRLPPNLQQWPMATPTLDPDGSILTRNNSFPRSTAKSSRASHS